MPKILAIDDDPAVLLALGQLVERQDFRFTGAADGTLGLAAFRADRPDVVLCDLVLPDVTGLEVLRLLRGIDPAVPVIMMTGHDSSEFAITSSTLGAFDYLLKPFTGRGLSETLARARAAGPGMIGRCPAMQDIYRAIGRVAQHRVTVLVLGETGTGKELVARAVHQHSGRAGRPFVPVNCAAVPEQLLESELFGHEKGAFTGADRRRVGKFEQASGGTLFLDEVGDMPPVTQAKLLRVLQDQTFERVGGSETVRTDARVIAATNTDLAAAADGGRFRSDLFFRLAGYTIHLPPLRDRGDDLTLLVRAFLVQLRAELGIAADGLSPDAMDRLRAYPWPGNVRELQGVLRRALLTTAGPVLAADLFPLCRPKARPTLGALTGDELVAFVAGRLAAGTRDLHAEWHARAEPAVLQLVLAHFHGNLTRAAEALGLNRMTLRARIRQFGLESSDPPS